jgi:hypothetical protein
LLLALALLVTASGWYAGNGTRATFTDTATSTGNAFSTGIVDLKLTDSDQTDQDTVTASLTLSNMVPGDSITRPIAVKNANGGSGQSIAARYAISSAVESGSSALAERFDLLIGRQASSGGTCDSTATFGNPGSASGAAWTLVYQGDLARSASLNLVGNPNVGSDAAAAGQISGDRALAANNGSEYLCFRVSFRDAQDAAAGQAVAGEGASAAHSYVQNDGAAANDNAYANLNTTITLTFAAEQTSPGTAS